MKWIKEILSGIGKKLWRNKGKTILGVIVFLLLFFFATRSLRQPQGIETLTVEKKTIKTTISANGQVKADSYAEVKFSYPGEVSWIGVGSGDTVSVGQALARQKSISLYANYKMAKNNYRDAEANADSVLDSVQGHETDESFAQRAQRTKAQVTRDNAWEQIVAAQDALGDATIYSPIAGTVIDTGGLTEGVNLTAGDIAGNFIKVADLSTLYFEAKVDELDYKDIFVNQEVDIVIDAYPEEECHGSVSEIHEEGEEETGGVIIIPVTVSFDYCFLDLLTGFNGEAEFVKDKKIKAIVIPKKYLVEKDGRNFVWLQKGDNSRNREMVPVELGIETTSEVEIVSGLKEGDRVLYIPS